MTNSPDAHHAQSSEKSKQQLMRRLTVWGLCLFSYSLTLVLLRTIKLGTGLDPFSVVFQGFIPVGAVCVAAVAISGFVLGAHYYKLTADRWDLLLLMAACVLLQFVIVGIDYWLLLRTHAELVGRLSYGQYFSLVLITPEYVSSSAQYGNSAPRPIGEAGYLLLLPRLGFLLALAKFAHTKFEAPTQYGV